MAGYSNDSQDIDPDLPCPFNSSALKDNPPSEEMIGEIAGLSMYVSLLFLIFQVPVWIVLMVVEVILENFRYSEQFRGLCAIPLLLLSEIILIVLIYRKVRRERSILIPDRVVLNDNKRVTVFNEKILERCFNVMAIIGMVWILIMGMPVESIKYFHIVIQGFAALFFLIFLILRLILMRRFAFGTFLSVVLSVASIVVALVIK